MGTRTAQYQGGSIISFIIVTVVVAALLVGGVILLRHRGEVARQSQVADNSQEQTEEVAKDEAADRTDADKVQDGVTSTDSTEGSEAATNDAASTGATSATDHDRGEAQAAPEMLPETGPTETTAAFIGIGAIAYAVTQYVRSRRARAELV